MVQITGNVRAVLDYWAGEELVSRSGWEHFECGANSTGWKKVPSSAKCMVLRILQNQSMQNRCFVGRYLDGEVVIPGNSTTLLECDDVSE